MDYSYAIQREMQCPHCHQTSTTEIWLIVDQAAQPELVQTIINGSFNMLSCPSCNQVVGEADEPLLIYRPNQEPPLLFAPAYKTALAEDQAHNVQALVKRLLDALESSDDDWVIDGLKRVHRDQLPTILSEASET